MQSRRFSFLSRQTMYAVVACLLIVLTTACSQETHTAPAAEGNSGRGAGRGRGGRGGGSVPVTTATVSQKAVPVSVKAVGTVEPLSTVQVRAQVTGQLSTVNFKEGQDVQEGQLLFTLDSRPFDAALAQAKAVLAKDTAQAQNARTLATRYTELFQKGLVPVNVATTE